MYSNQIARALFYEWVPKSRKIEVKQSNLENISISKIFIIQDSVTLVTFVFQEGPPVGEMLSILGKETTIERLKHAYALLDKR